MKRAAPLLFAVLAFTACSSASSRATDASVGGGKDADGGTEGTDGSSSDLGTPVGADAESIDAQDTDAASTDAEAGTPADTGPSDIGPPVDSGCGPACPIMDMGAS